MSRVVSTSGSVRVDLLGGTLDINPINLILPKVVTLNCATSLQAEVMLTETSEDGVLIVSDDYKESRFFPSSELKNMSEENLEKWGVFRFVLEILIYKNLTSKVKVSLSSGAPAGSGLGGSSTMGVTLYKAIDEYLGKAFFPIEAINIVSSIEKRIINRGPTGYQDYYPALYGGVLALHGEIAGVVVSQLYSDELKHSLEDYVTLVYSGESRNSGINNWEVFKQFFDGPKATREGLAAIAKVSDEAYQSILKKDYKNLVSLIGQEGEIRESLFPNILTPSMKNLKAELKKESTDIGLKICGAGGGGCFLITHPNMTAKDFRKKFASMIEGQGMKLLPFQIMPPIL
jgi:D-glycero-alpha-D-manno-heptose-7-phosphate kinase